MSNELARRNLEISLQLGDLGDLVKASEVVMLAIDTSGSMASAANAKESAKQKAAAIAGWVNGWSDGPNTHYQRRIDCLRIVVTGILNTGHVPMIAFGGPYDAQVRFVDVVPEPDGGTPMHAAIALAKSYGANRLVVISDGAPDLPGECRIEAQGFGGRIDCVYIGEENDGGHVFLKDLAQLTGGTCTVDDIGETLKLTSKIIGLLEGGTPSRGPITGPGFSVEESSPVGTDDEGDGFEEDEDEEDDDDED